MEYLSNRILTQAEADGRFEQKDTDLLEILVYKDAAPNVRPLRPLIQGGRGVEGTYCLREWLKAKDSSAHVATTKPIGGLQLLVQQSRTEHTISVPDKIPWVNKDTFMEISKLMKLPLMYVPLLNYCSGVAKVFVTPKTDLCKPRLDFVAQNTNYDSDSWSLAFSYDSGTGMTSGIFSANARTNPDVILEHLRASASLVHHPILLPVILFRTLMESSCQHRSQLHKDIYTIEKELGYVSCKDLNPFHQKEMCSVPSETLKHLAAVPNQAVRDPPESKFDLELQNWRSDEDKLRETPEYFQHMSRRVNTCKKQQASRDGRHKFWKQFRDVLYDSFNALDAITSETGKQHLAKPQLELRHWTELESALFESLDGRDVNYNARIETQLSVLYSLITQRDSRDQASIAKAAKQDGADMKFFAYLGSCFLPANFVATLFTIERFQPQHLSSAALFAVFLSIALPLNILCLALYWFKSWFWRFRRERLTSRRVARHGTGIYARGVY